MVLNNPVGTNYVTNQEMQIWFSKFGLGNTADGIFNAGYSQLFLTKASPARTKTDNSVFYRSSCSAQPLATGKLLGDR